MSLRESIGKLPIWKAVMILLIIFFFMLVGIEEIFVSRIFSILERSIVHFEKVFKEEAKEVDSDYQKFNERQEYDSAVSALNSFEMFEHHRTPRQEYFCGYKTINNKLEKFYDLAYVKRNEFVRTWITQQIVENKKMMDKAIDKGEFDPSKCKEKK